ncbi:MAG: hypothetical protein EOP11_16160 [Proteobacteria bacterium]|nr:MAG: hypothetical protein EOP11_16160 [Pseudomonadota bacterium]
MKFALLALALALPNFAAAAPLVCQGGELESDNLIAVIVKNSRSAAVQIEFYESTVIAPASAIVKKGNTIAIVEQMLNASGEGQEWKAKTSAFLVYSPEKKEMLVTVLMDGEMVRAGETLKCK